MTKVSAKPEGYHTITPYLIVNQGQEAIEFYKKGFGATVVMCMQAPHNKIGHAELKIGDSKFMLADECFEMDAKSPEAFGGSPVGIHLYVEDVDTFIKNAVAHGAKLTRPITDQFYGDRSGALKDPFGHMWYVSTHIEDVSEEEMKKRMADLSKDKWTNIEQIIKFNV